MQGKYYKHLPIYCFLLGMGIWQLLEAGTGLCGSFVRTKMSTHASSCKSQCWGKRQQLCSSLHKGSRLLVLVLERRHNWKLAEVMHVWSL